MSGTDNSLIAITFTDRQTGWVVGGSGNIWHTDDGGKNWQYQTSGTSNYLYTITFTDAQTNWITGETGEIFRITIPNERKRFTAIL